MSDLPQERFIAHHSFDLFFIQTLEGEPPSGTHCITVYHRMCLLGDPSMFWRQGPRHT